MKRPQTLAPQLQRKGRSGWLGIFALLAVFPLQAEDSAHWLERMSQAGREQSYHGSYVYERPGVFTTQDIWRAVGEAGVRERLLQTAGRYREWVRHDGQLVCSTAPAHAAASEPDDTPYTALDTRQLARWYNVRILGATRIAARPVTVVAVDPRDGFRYAHELYIDNETGLMLKSLLIDDNRELLERFQFAAISFDPAVARAGLEPARSCRETVAELPADAGQAAGLEPGWLPPGFALDARRGAGGPVTAQTYTDGLASFTLFVDPLGQGSLAEDMRAQLGPTVVVSRHLMAGEQLLLVTVVGEIPPRAAERVVESLGNQVEAGAGP